MNMSCVFCSSVEIKKRPIFENELVVAFPTNIPITAGHTLVCPKRCVKKFEDMTVEEKSALFVATEKIMGALRKSHGAEGFNCAWNEEKLAGQSVPHFHLHIVPRKEGDTGLLGFDPRSMLYRTGDREPVSMEELIKTKDSIRSALGF